MRARRLDRVSSPVGAAGVELRWRLAARPNGDAGGVESMRCGYCLTEGDPEDLTIDHIVPLALGGPNWEGNMVLACEPCNQSKGPRTPGQWRPGVVWVIERLNRPAAYFLEGRFGVNLPGHLTWRPFADLELPSVGEPLEAASP